MPASTALSSTFSRNSVMKIITGQYGGRRFDPPRNLQARPTTDLAKQALFNILQCRIDFEGLRALDLFSGTGSISFELLSRGASSVVSVEMGRPQQQFIQKVAEQLHISRANHQLVRGDVFRYLSARPAQPFQFIFADPPYALSQLPELPSLVLNADWLTPDGLFVLEHGKEHDFSSLPGFQELRIYGAVHFSFFAPPAQE